MVDNWVRASEKPEPSKILITGEKGFIGSHIFKYLQERGCDVVGLGMKVQGALVKSKVMSLNPKTIIHCAAKKEVRWCESNPRETHEANIIGTSNLVNHSKSRKFIYLSTDMVFSGGMALIPPEDNHGNPTKPHPNTVYGMSKAVGEDIVRGLKNHAILRTGAVYGWTERDIFIQMLLLNLEKGETVGIYGNFYNSPTYVINLCEMVEEVIKDDKVGTFHCCGPERMSKYEFAIAVAKEWGFDEKLIRKDAQYLEHDVSMVPSDCYFKTPFVNVEEGLKRMRNEGNTNTQR